MKKTAIKEQDILNAYNHKQIDFDFEDLQLKIAEINSQIDALWNKTGDPDKDIAEFCALHISRMKHLVTLYTTINENIDKHYFVLYLQSAMAVSSHTTDFFSYKIVCEDFEAMIEKLKESGESLLRCLSDIDDQALPHGSKWELIFVTQLQTELPEKPIQYTDTLARMKGISDGGYFAPVRSKLFLDACAYLLNDKDVDQFVDSAPKLLSYLFQSTKYSKVGKLHGQLLNLLLVKAQNRLPHAMRLLCEFADNLTIDGGLDLVEKVLDAIVKPKKPSDNDLNYYSSFALGRILCLVLNQPRLARFAIHPNQMNDLQSTFYHRSLANYFTDYFNALVEKNAEDTGLRFTLELLRLYDFARRELPVCRDYQNTLKIKFNSAFVQRLAMHARLGARKALDHGDENVFRMAELFINNLLDCFSYREIVGGLIKVFEFALAHVITPEDFLKSDPFYVAIFATLTTAKRVNESEKHFHKRIASVIMLSQRYSLSENTWNHYYTIFGEDKNQMQDFDHYVKSRPDKICISMLLVMQQHHRFFPNHEMTTAHLVSCIYTWSESHRLMPVRPEVDEKIRTLFSKLSADGMMAVFEFPPHCFESVMNKFSSEIVKRWCEIILPSSVAHHTAALVKLCQQLTVMGKYDSLFQLFDAALHRNNTEKFEHLLRCFRVDHPESAAFIFDYMRKYTPQSQEKQMFIRHLDRILTQVPQRFWQNSKEPRSSMLLFDLCVSGVGSRNAMLSLLELGADPLFRVNNTCAFVESIKLCAGGNGSLLQICEYVQAQELQLDFTALHAVCEDPLGLACRFEVPKEIIELMLHIGFDVAKYKVSNQMMSGHEVIMSRLKPAQPALAKSGSNGGRDMFGFFKADDADENEVPEIYCDPITYEIMDWPVVCLLDKKTYDEHSIRAALTKKPCSPFDEKAVLGGRSIDSVLVENMDLRTAIQEYLTSRQPKKNDDVGNNNNAKK